MPPTYAVLFKCHYWDDFTQRQLGRLRQRVTSGDIFVVVDETHGAVAAIDHPADRILRISQAAAHAIGLEHFGGTPVFWYSNDYPLHLMARQYPDYPYYVMLEFDVVISVDLDAVITRLHEAHVDFVGEPIRTPLPQWPWRDSCTGWYPPGQVHHWLTCLAILSNRAEHYLYQRRVAASQRLRDGQVESLPMCEAAIPTELHLAGFQLMQLNLLGSTTFYDSAPPQPEDRLPSLRNHAFVHPLLDRQRFVRNLFKDIPDPAGLLDPAHPFRKHINGMAFELALPTIYHSLWSRHDDRGCRRVLKRMRRSKDRSYLYLHGIDGDNLALAKPAVKSSDCEWSLRPDDANGAVTGPVTGQFTFHTAMEDRPWWMVDLLAQQSVGVVRVFNRMDIAWRANGVELFVSVDGRRWDLAGRHEGDTPFGGIDGHPLEIDVSRTIRFVRLEIPHPAILHLDQVQVLRPRTAA